MIGVPQQQSDRAKKGTSGASVAQLPAGFGGVRRQPRVVCRTGAGDDAGRADRPVRPADREGVHHRVEDQVGGGQSRPETGALIAGMCAGADSIEDVDVVRSGGMKACSAVSTRPRRSELCCGSSVSGMPASWNRRCAHLAALCQRVDLLPGGDVRAFVDIDSLLRPVYGHAKQGASYGHTPRSPANWSCVRGPVGGRAEGGRLSGVRGRHHVSGPNPMLGMPSCWPTWCAPTDTIIARSPATA